MMKANTVFSIPMFFYCLCCCVPVLGYAHGSRSNGVEIDIVDEQGQAFNTYKSSHQRFYLEAVKGGRYGIRVHNPGSRRIGVVIAVDGRNILSGESSHLRRQERMYVIRPGQSSTFEGWRVSDRKVHRFFFTDSGASYAAQFDDASAMGVIAVAVYPEKPKIVYQRSRKSITRSVKPGYLSDAEEAAGTGFGEAQDSLVHTVEFEPETLAEKTYFKYEWRASLCRKGVITCQQKPPTGCEKNRFWPQDCAQDNEGYAPYPPQYRYHHK